MTGLPDGPGASSSSSTSTASAAAAKPAADAVTVAVWVPSTTASSTAATAKVPLAWPAGMVTVTGTVAAVSSSLRSVTTSSEDVSPDRVTVPVATPPSSEIASRSMESVSASAGASARYFCARKPTVAACSASSSARS